MPEIREQITCRVNRSTKIWLEALAEGTQLSINQIATAFIERARAEGWTVEPPERQWVRTVKTSRPGDLAPPGAGPGPAQPPRPEG